MREPRIGQRRHAIAGALLLVTGLVQAIPSRLVAQPVTHVVLVADSVAMIYREGLGGSQQNSRDFLVSAKANQRLIVSIATSTPWLFFAVLSPGGAVMANNSVTGANSWIGTLPTEGDYRVRVFLGPNAVKASANGSFLLRLALGSPIRSAATTVSGTTWQLVSIKGPAPAAVDAADRTKYTVAFEANGSAIIRADCNRGHGSWSSPTPGTLQISQIALTRAMCLNESLSDRFAKELGNARGFELRNGRLFITVEDGSIYELEPLSTPTPATPAPSR